MAEIQVQHARGHTTDVAAYMGPIGEIIVNVDNGNLAIQDGVTAGGGWSIEARPAGGFAYSAPSTGATITTVLGERQRIVDAAATIATLTVVMPPTPNNGDTFELMTSHLITALTVNAPGGATVNASSFLMSPNSGASWMYRSANMTWYRRY